MLLYIIIYSAITLYIIIKGIYSHISTFSFKNKESLMLSISIESMPFYLNMGRINLFSFFTNIFFVTLVSFTLIPDLIFSSFCYCMEESSNSDYYENANINNNNSDSGESEQESFFANCQDYIDNSINLIFEENQEEFILNKIMNIFEKDPTIMKYQPYDISKIGINPNNFNIKKLNSLQKNELLNFSTYNIKLLSKNNYPFIYVFGYPIIAKFDFANYSQTTTTNTLIDNIITNLNNIFLDSTILRSNLLRLYSLDDSCSLEELKKNFTLICCRNNSMITQLSYLSNKIILPYSELNDTYLSTVPLELKSQIGIFNEYLFNLSIFLMDLNYRINCLELDPEMIGGMCLEYEPLLDKNISLYNIKNVSHFIKNFELAYHDTDPAINHYFNKDIQKDINIDIKKISLQDTLNLFKITHLDFNYIKVSTKLQSQLFFENSIIIKNFNSLNLSDKISKKGLFINANLFEEEKQNSRFFSEIDDKKSSYNIKRLKNN